MSPQQRMTLASTVNSLSLLRNPALQENRRNIGLDHANRSVRKGLLDNTDVLINSDNCSQTEQAVAS